ncbi:hypothetical protein [Actinoplanes sp. NPDC048796]|uniref:hypothetical protein n=2 Tax=unclassified Actinoplanes TaxID=2626549 RepID=UPI00340449A8
MGTEQKRHRCHRQRNGQHRGVGHHVHPIGVIHAIGEERICAIGEHPRTMRHHPLKESLILWIIAQLVIKIEPEWRGDVQRDDDEGRAGQEIPPCGNAKLTDFPLFSAACRRFGDG